MAAPTSLNGGAGADIMRGDGGDDTYIVDNAGDIIGETPGNGTDTVQASVGYTLAPNVENLILTGGVAINGTGNAQNNALTGNIAANVLKGGFGNDTLNGGDGDDTLFGDGGNDLLTGGAGADRFRFQDASTPAMPTMSPTSRLAARDPLENAIFASLGAGPLAAGAFVTGTAAADASDRIIYDAATGNLFYDSDGSGAGAALLFATLYMAPQRWRRAISGDLGSQIIVELGHSCRMAACGLVILRCRSQLLCRFITGAIFVPETWSFCTEMT